MLIKNGTVITAHRTYEADIKIERGKIAGIGKDLDAQNLEKTIDAAGLWIIPGLIDMHVHFLSPFMGQMGAADFYSGTKAAAFGGVTTILDFTNTDIGQTMLESVKIKEEQAEGKALIDYSFHPRIVEAPQRIIDEIKELVDYGVPTFKMFMTYRRQGIQAHDGILMKVMEEAAKHNALPGVHAENNDIVESLTEEAVEAGETDWHAHARTRPPIAEEEAIQRAVYFAQRIGSPLFIYHVSTKGGAEAIAKAQKQGHPIYAETCPHYLSLTDEILKREDGYKYICSPPMRPKEHIEAMWEGLQKGYLSVTGSDDCNYSSEAKRAPMDVDKDGELIPEFQKVVNGLTGMESRFHVLMAKGVQSGKINMNEFVRITSYNAAKIFGLSAKKGDISIGYDADLVLIDPHKEMKLTYDKLHLDTQYNPWEGLKVKGIPVMTMVRGNPIIEQGQVVVEPGYGRFVRRKLDPSLLRQFGNF